MDATVIEVARFRRPPIEAPPEEADQAADDDEDDDFWLDEPTLIVDALPAVETPTPTARPAVARHDLFAEPPALPATPAPEARAPVDRARRKRLLMLAFTVMAGAWVTLRPPRTRAPVRSHIIAVQAADAQVLATRLPPIPTPDHVDVVLAANALAAARYPDALAQYRALATEHPDQPAFALIAHVLRNELEDRCKLDEQEGCR